MAGKTNPLIKGCSCLLTILLLVGVVIAAIYGMGNLPGCNMKNPDKNAHGVPKEIVEAIQADLNRNDHKEELTNCDMIVWVISFDDVKPGKNAQGEAVSNTYYATGKAIGKTNIYGTHQEAVVGAFYSWDEKTKTLKFLKLEIAEGSWEK